VALAPPGTISKFQVYNPQMRFLLVVNMIVTKLKMKILKLIGILIQPQLR